MNFLCHESGSACTSDCPTRSSCNVSRQPLFIHSVVTAPIKISKTEDKLLDFTMANIKEEAYINGIINRS